MNDVPADNSTLVGEPFSIALAQIAPVLGDRDRNFELHRERIEAARQQDADLIVFPELSLTGYFLRDMVPDVALPRDAQSIRDLAASAGSAALVAGFVEESPQNRFYNAAFFAEGGQIKHVHRKVYLPTYGLFDEKRYFAAGQRICAFDTQRFGRVGLLVCEDFWHLSTAAVLQADEIDLLICVANSPARGVESQQPRTALTYQRLTSTIAEMLGVLVVVVHRVGFEDGLCFWGASRIVGPDGEAIAEAPPLEEAVVVARFDPAELRRRRVMTPLARDERLLLTIEELKRIRRRRYDA